MQKRAILAPQLCDFMDNSNTLNLKPRNSFSKYLHLMDGSQLNLNCYCILFHVLSGALRQMS
jgi:hypothetical protein